MTVNETTPKGGRRTPTSKARAKTVEPVEPAEQAAPPAGADTQALGPEIATALHAAAEKKALAPVVLDLRGVASFTDYFLIASGTNQRQVQAIADEVVERLKAAGTRPERVEGYKTAEWVLLDYGDFLVHVFDDKARRFYDLERLWRDAARVELPPELGGATDSSLTQDV
jgi:ribosome-associated protein